MARFSPGQKVKVTQEAARGGHASYVGKTGEVRRVHQVGPGGFIVDVAFEGEAYTPSFWERWLEAA